MHASGTFRFPLCLLSAFGLGHGQVAENRQWRLVNAEPLVGFWSVVEVEFHSTGSCNEQVEGAPIASGSVMISLSGSHFVSKAADGNATPVLEAGWWSDCGYVLGSMTDFGGGCAAGEAWIGLDSGFTTFEVKCVRLVQPLEENHSASSIGLDRWDGATWVRVKTFLNTGGVEAAGRFLDLTVDENSKWRLRPLKSQVAAWVDAPWSVQEWQLFPDVECSGSPLTARFVGASFQGNGSAWDGANPPSRAQDGLLDTGWASYCTGADVSGCEEGTWLEAQLHTAAVVRCMRLLQGDAFAPAVQLQAGSGLAFANASLFYELSAGSWQHLARFSAAAAAPGELWRLVPVGEAPSAWRVAELEMYTNASCESSSQILSTAFGPGSLVTSSVSLAADGQVATEWQAAGPTVSSWQGRYEGDSSTSHSLGWPWLGLSAGDAAAAPLCLRFLQGNSSQSSANDAVLQRWNGTVWLDFEDGLGLAPYFRDLAEGLWYNPIFWLRMPLLDRMQWRLRASDIMLNHWAVKELHFYEYIDCYNEVTGLQLAAGQDPFVPSRPASWAFDRDMLTDWWSACSECLAGAAWLGVALPAPQNVRCFQLFQSSMPPNSVTTPWFSGSVSLEKWNGNRWVSVAGFSGLARGAWEQNLIFSHTPVEDAFSGLQPWVTQANRLWRVTSLDDVPRRWTVASVSFYWDLACSTRMEEGNFMASGWALGFEVAHAFLNESLELEWASACDGCGARQAWLALSTLLPSWPRCVRIYQTTRAGSGTAHLAVERFDGSDWALVADKQEATAAAWEDLRLPGPGGIYSYPYPVSTFEGLGSFGFRVAWRLLARPTRWGWRVSSLRFFSDLSCLNETVGIPGASSFLQGRGPNLSATEDTSSYWQASGLAEAWLGQTLVDSPVPRCIQLWQPEDAWSVSTVALQVYYDQGAGTWLEVANFSDLNVQVWDNLHIFGPLPAAVVTAAFDPSLGIGDPPLAPVNGSIWRIANGAAIDWSWAISHLRFFPPDGQGGCSQPLEGAGLASGQATAESAPSLALGSTGVWRSSCFDCAVGAAWIGVILAVPSEVACVEITQSQEELYSTPTVRLDRWAGEEWTEVQTFTRVSVGERVFLGPAWNHPALRQRARVVSLESPAGAWAVSELQFFLNVECSVEVSGVTISSGSSGDHMPRLAMDGNLSTYWQALPAQTEPQWLGLHFAVPSDVKCAMLRQVDTPGQWAPSVALELWNGSAWESEATLPNLQSGGWFALHLFQSAWPGLKVNFQDAESRVPSGYTADTGAMYPGLAANGFRFGWNCLPKGSNRGYYDDPVLDTQVALCTEASRWELDVIAGRFYALLQYSDPGFGGETDGCTLEGQSAAVGRYGAYEAPSRSLILSVDSRLTFEGTFDTCSSLSALEISSLPLTRQMWRLRAVSVVPERWIVQELGLFADANCATDDLSGAREELFSSGYQEGHPPQLALDGLLNTSWRSACGCQGGAWIGLLLRATVQCVRLFQDENFNALASAVSLESWNGTAWLAEALFAELQGGAYGRYNQRWAAPRALDRWRLVLASANDRLAVAELGFYGDLGCQEPLQGLPIASETDSGSAALDAVDGDASTSWVSACDPCAPGEAWLGLHLDQSVEVLCAAVTLAPMAPARRLQLTPFSTGGVPVSAKLQRLELELWNGSGWASAGIFLEVRPGARAYASRFLLASLEASRAWRVVSAAPTTMPWRVQELEFHTQSDCNAKSPQGVPVASSQLPAHPPSKAFDGDATADSAWAAGCTTAGCAAYEWIGVLLESPLAFQCLRIYQASGSLLGAPYSTILRVERWDGSAWEVARSFGTVTPLGGGAWADLIILPAAAKFSMEAMQWRLLAEGAVEQHWSVAEVAFFSDVECRSALTGTVSASGEAANRLASAAVDGQVDTFWWSQAAPGPNEAWLGFAFASPQLVRCVQVVLDSDPGYRTSSIQLQSRPEVDWFHIRSFDNLLAARQNLPVFEAATDRPAGSMWRVLNQGALQSWTVVELEFYADTECTRVELGNPISPGYAPGQEPSQAFDLGLRSWWRAPCQPCTPREAWLGLSFFSSGQPRAVEAQCVVLLQGSGAENSSQNVSVERWDGQMFSALRRFDFVPGGEFIKLRLDLLSGSAGAMVVDAERKELLLKALEETEDPEELRGELEVKNDKIQAQVTLAVAAWPPELVSSGAVSQSFLDAVDEALRKALSLRLALPAGNIFVDNLVLENPQQGLSSPSVTAELTLYVPLADDSRVVNENLRRISQDPYNLESLFLLDQFKGELRKATGLSPLLTSISAQVDASMELRFGAPQLLSKSSSTTTTQVIVVGEEFQDQSNLAMILVIGAVGLCCGAMLCRVVAFRRERQREAARETPRPRRRAGGGLQYLWCCCYCCRRRRSSPFQSNREQLEQRDRGSRASTVGRSQSQRRL